MSAAVAQAPVATLPSRAIEALAIYSTEEAAFLTTLKPQTIREYIRTGVIRAKGRPFRIKGSELLKLA